ncbi:MAG: murein biosynthesis integral membrane protein MurJ [bacterium]|nr:murein biosynthesis integral membrane protein MurJ [bacterium]
MVSLTSHSKINIAQTTLLIAFFSLLSRVVGLFRDRIFAGQFGAGDTLDVYYAAFRIPDFLFNLLILGTMTAAFIPVFAAYRLKDENAAWRLGNTIFNLTFLAMVFLSAVLFLFAPALLHLIVPGFSGEKLEQTLQLTRIMLVSPVFFALSSVFSSILNTFKKFVVVSILPIIYNLAIVFGILVLYPKFGPKGLAFGVVLGAFLHLLLQLPALMRIGYRWSPVLDLKSGGVARFIKLFVPRIFTMDFSPIIASAIGSLMAVGSITAYNLANNLQSVPLGVFAISYATVAFPHLADAAAKGDRDLFRKIFNSNLSQILYLMVPFSLLLLVLRAQIVRLLLGTGHFGWQDTIMTISALEFFALSLFSQGLVPLLTRAFFSLRNTVAPVITGLVSALINLFLAWFLVNRYNMGVAGLALSFSVSSIANLLMLFGWLEFKYGNLIDRFLILKIEKILVATVAMAISSYATLYLVAPFVNTRTVVGLGFQTLISLVVGMLVDLGFGYILNLSESRHIVRTTSTWLAKLRVAFFRAGDWGM